MVENNLQENHVVENIIPCVWGCVIVNQVELTENSDYGGQVNL